MYYLTAAIVIIAASLLAFTVVFQYRLICRQINKILHAEAEAEAEAVKPKPKPEPTLPVGLPVRMTARITPMPKKRPPGKKKRRAARREDREVVHNGIISHVKLPKRK